jgi:3-dehydroquinate synthase
MSRSSIYRVLYSLLPDKKIIFVDMSKPLIPIGTPIYLGDDALTQLELWLKKEKMSSVFILVDEHTLQHCLPRLIGRVKSLANAEIIELESGELNKTPDVVLQVWRVLSELGADRQSLIINLGGGVLSDLGGFVASTFKRGIRFLNIPTTLLAQIDASVGGKTGVDLDGLKNEIGTFSEPEAVFIYPDFLQTLSKREMLAGFAEAIKHGLIADASYWKKIKITSIADNQAWPALIARSVEIKSEIVQEDPKEKGLRKSLNFGHTIGHAIEAFFLERVSSSVLHGEAVAAGMICEAWLSNQQAKLSADELEDITQFITQRYLPITLDDDADHRLIELMRHDKKNEGGKIRFTLLERIGQTKWNVACSPNQIIEALQYYRHAVKSTLLMH